MPKKKESQIQKIFIVLLVLIICFIVSLLVSPVQCVIGGASYWGTVDKNYILPYTGVGADYLWFSNADPSIWTQWTFDRLGTTYYGHIDLVNFWKPLFHTTQLSICFTSASVRQASWYYKDKFATVLNLFGERNAPVIVAHYPAWDAVAHCGSQALWDDWVQFAQDWKGDSRISAIKLYGEPVGAIDNGQGTDTKSWVTGMTRRDMARWFVELVKAVHQVDPNRIVIYPFMGLSYYNQYELFADIEDTGIFNEPNTMFDIIHPYYFGNPSNPENDGSYYGNPAGKPYWYETQFILPWIHKVSLSKVWCGETFMFTAPCSETGYTDPVLSEQKLFFTNMVNVFVRNKLAFNLWGLLILPIQYKPDGAVFYPTDEHIKAIEDSIYGETFIGTYVEPTPYPTYPPPSPYPTPVVTPTPTVPPSNDETVFTPVVLAGALAISALMFDLRTGKRKKRK